MSVPTYQLKIDLAGTEPPVWRRLLVGGDMNLGLLHAVIQVAMGWTNSHLHLFRVGWAIALTTTARASNRAFVPLSIAHYLIVMTEQLFGILPNRQAFVK